MKDYINYEVLNYFRSKLLSLFAIIGHTHTKSDISDLKYFSVIATDDNDGNVTLECFSNMKEYSDRTSVLEGEVATLKATLNDNDILVANNVSK